jgi:hypothetical protein
MKRLIFFALLSGACGNDASMPDGGDAMCMTPTRVTARRDVEAVAVGGGKAIVYGGDEAPFNPMSTMRQLVEDVWQIELGCGNWTQLQVAPGAGPRGGYAAAFDAKRNRLIAFGGQKGATANPPVANDLWALDLASLTWSQLNPGGTVPQARVGGHMVYDAPRDRILMFGGTRSRLSGPALADLEELSFANGADGTWTALSNGTNGAPTARYDAALAIDTKRQLLVAFGGAASFNTFYNEVWVFDLQTNAWRQVTVTGNQPSKRLESKGGYDPIGDKIWLFGGHDLGTLGLLNDTWSLQLDEAGTSATFTNVLVGDTDLAVSGVDHLSPERRAKHGLVFADGKLWIFLGGGDCGSLDDAWTLDVAMPTAWQPAVKALVGETCFRKAMEGQSCMPGTSMECTAPF